MKNIYKAKNLLDYAKEAGFQAAGIVNIRDLYNYKAESPLPFNLHKLKQTLNRQSINRGAFLVAALSCYRSETDDLSLPDDPHGLFAPFTRRNFYREAVIRMKGVVKKIISQTGLAKRDMRIFCNSHIPEKPLAVASGLGFYGKNDLVICPGLGSLFIICLVYLPFRVDNVLNTIYLKDQAYFCQDCDACIKSCPVQAIQQPGFVNTKLCLQAKAALMHKLTAKTKSLWLYRIYGCQTCQQVCPFNQHLDKETATRIGELGPSVSLKKLLSMTLPELELFFRHTALDLSWISRKAILRNIIIAAGNRKDHQLISLLLPYCQNKDKVLRDAALWAVKNIENQSL